MIRKLDKQKSKYAKLRAMQINMNNDIEVVVYACSRVPGSRVANNEADDDDDDDGDRHSISSSSSPWSYDASLADSSSSSSSRFKVPPAASLSLVEFTALFDTFLCFMRRFWNHVLTCVCARANEMVGADRALIERV